MHVRRQRVIWLLCIPLTAVSGFVTHGAVQSMPAHTETGAHMSSTPFDLSHLPVCLIVCALIALAGMALTTVRGPLTRPPLWLFALVPPFGFVAQEQIFMLLEEGRPGAGLSLLVGLALQVPFALAAYTLAVGVLSLAAVVVRSLRSRPAVFVRAPVFLLEPSAASWPQPPAFVLGHGQRAPPAFQLSL